MPKCRSSTCDLVAAGPKNKDKSGSAVCDLNSLLPKVKASTQLPIDDVIARVRDVASRLGRQCDRSWPTPTAPRRASASTMRPKADTDPYLGFEAARRSGEHHAPAEDQSGNGGDDWSEHQVIVKKGETVGSILRELGCAPDEIKTISRCSAARHAKAASRKARSCACSPTPAGLGHMQPLRVIIAGDSGIEAAVALSDTGQYVPVDIRNVDAGTGEGAEEATDDDGSGVRLYQSIYETALRNNVPNAVIEETSPHLFLRCRLPAQGAVRRLVSTFSMPTTRTTRRAARYATPRSRVGGETKRYYHYQTSDDGVYDYYDETGKSAKKFLVRKPVAIGIMRSGFGWRTHPMLAL